MRLHLGTVEFPARADLDARLEAALVVRARFVDQLAVNDSGCWEWSGYRRKDGYGETSVDGFRLRTHRLAWIIFRGAIPANLWVLHHCDNPPCCNPDHLFLGDVLANVRDMIAKGRDNNLPQREQLWKKLRSKTHCPAGHPYAGDNLAILKRSDGSIGRRCRTCHSARESARTARKRAA